jgi:hypothetical protein
VRAERENELTVLVEHEPFIWEREKRRKGSGRVVRADGVIVRVLVMLDMYFVSVKYVFDSIKLMCVCVKLLKI